MDLNLTHTKIVPPRRSANLLSRPRLLDLLYSIIDYRLFLVIAPAGYGKTSALVDWAHQAELPVCWYAVDEFDQDARQFIAYVIAAIAQRFPDFGARSASALRGMTQTLDLPRLVQVIVNDAFEHIRDHFALVIDDYHLVQEDETISAFISTLAQQIDESAHIVLVSRTLLAVPDLPLMIARSQIGGLGYEDLTFRTGEVQDLVLQNYHLTVPTAEAQALVEEAEGWITGLLLSAQSMWQGMADRVRTARVSGMGLYDYMAQQTLDQQPPDVRKFLLRTSLFDVFNAELCEAVLGQFADDDWSALMNVVLRSNLFVVPVGGGDAWLRYHHLFRDFLRTRMDQEAPEERERILGRLALVYRERQLWDRAYDVYDRLGDQEGTADLLEEAGLALIQEGQNQRLQGWLSALPYAIVTSRPALLSLKGVVASMTGDPKSGAQLQVQAEAGYRAAQDWVGTSRALVRLAVDYRLLGDYEASLHSAEEALALSDRFDGMVEAQADAYRAKGLCLYWMGKPDLATDCLELAFAAYDALDNQQLAAIVRMELGLVHMDMGNFAEALDNYNDCLPYWAQTQDAVRQAALFNNLGVLHHYQGNYRGAVVALERAVTYARQGAYPRLEGAAMAGLGDVFTDLGTYEAAEAAYHEAGNLAQRMNDRFLTLYMNLAQANLACMRSRFAQAHRYADVAKGQVEASQAQYEQGLWHVVMGRIALYEGQPSTARTHLDAGVACFESGKRRLDSARARLFLAVACAESGDLASAEHSLEQAFAVAAQLGGHQAMLAVARELTPFLEKLELAPALGAQVAELLEQVAAWVNDLPSLRRDVRRQSETVSFAPPHLRLQALGQAQVWVGGIQITGSDWQAQVARDMVFCLLAHREGLTGEALGLFFWPDKDPLRLNMHLKKTLYRIRRALGDASVVFENGRYRFNRSLDYEYDVELFQESIAAARTATDAAMRIVAYEEAVRLYQGSYLPDVDGTWVLTARERLWQAYRGAAMALVQTHLERQEPETALRYCYGLLAEDPCQEDVHRLAMRAHAALGNRSAVVRQFEHCKQLLAQELDVQPSPQTQSLYRKLVG